MSGEQPFLHLFESLGRLPQSHAEAINRQAYQSMLDALSVPLDHPGRCILLRAPRAGHGKTHLLSRLQHHLAPGHEFIPLHPATGCRIDAASVIDDALRRIGRPLPAAGGLCGLDLIVRRLYSIALQPLVSSGEVPCIDRDGALASLRNRPLETFDFHHPSAVTAHWIRDNFEVLGPRLALELSQLTGIAPRAVGFWVDAMFHFAVTPTDIPGRVDALAVAVFTSGSGDGVSMERLSALLALLSLLMRVVLVADDLEGFSSDETAALRLAAFLSTLRHSAERLDVVLSLNQDIWESAFLPRLSGGLADRLSEVVVELEPLTEEQMIALLESRVPGLGMRVLDYMRAENLDTHARGVLRAAAAAWTRASRQPAGAPPPQTRIEPPAAMVTPAPAPEPAPLPAAVAAALAAFSTEATPPPAAISQPEPQPVSPPEPPPVAAAASPVESPFQALAETTPAPAPEASPVAPAVVPVFEAASPVFSAEPVAPQPPAPDPVPVQEPTPPPAWQPPAFHEVAPPPATEPAPPVVPVFEAPAPPPPLSPEPQTPVVQAPPAWQPPAIHEVTPPPVVAPAAPAFEAVAPAQPLPEPQAPVFQAPPAWQPPAFEAVAPQPVAEPAPSVPDFEAIVPAPPAPEPQAAVFHTPTTWQPPSFHEVTPQPVVSEPAPSVPGFEAVAPPAPTVETPAPVFSAPPAWQAPVFQEPAAFTPSPETPAPAVFEPVPPPAAPEPAPTFQAPPAWQSPAFQPAPEPVAEPAAPMPQSPFQPTTSIPTWHSATPVAPLAGTLVAPAPAAPAPAATWHEATAPTAPFSAPAPAAQPQPVPLPSQPAAAAPAETQPPIDQDRVEDLLRQFRERYSRPNP